MANLWQTIDSAGLDLAWMQSPSLAINVALRSQSLTAYNYVRKLLLRSPESAINEPEALDIMFSGSLPGDVSSQLKVSDILFAL